MDYSKLAKAETELVYSALQKIDKIMYLQSAAPGMDSKDQHFGARVIKQGLDESRLFLIDPSLLFFKKIQSHMRAAISIPFNCVFIEASESKYMATLDLTGNEKISLSAFMVVETKESDHQISFFCDRWDQRGKIKSVFLVTNESRANEAHAVLSGLTEIARGIVGIINDRQTLAGAARVNHHFERHGAPPHRVRRIIIFKDKNKKSESMEEVIGRKVDWKHTWEVMGHWRKVALIGKDRNGDYLIRGKTWVKPCKRGAGELIKKNRVMKKYANSPKQN